MIAERTDQEIIDLVRAGNRKAFSEIVKRHQKPILRLSLRFVKDLDLAQDVTQEAFIKAYEKLNSFEGRSSFKSWLFQIAVNTAKNKIREGRRETADIENVNLAVGAEAEKGMVDTAVADLLQAEVEKLPFRQKTALVLRIYEDMSFKEIAQVMDCPYDTAKANYRHALLKLRESLEGQKDLRTWTQDFGGFFVEASRLVEVDT